MDSVTTQIRKDRYDRFVNAIAALLTAYGVSQPPRDEFNIETLEAVTDFEEFDILRDFAVRLGDAQSVEQCSGEKRIEFEVHPHHLIATVAAFPDLAANANLPEPDLRVIVEGLCYSYLVAATGMTHHRQE